MTAGKLRFLQCWSGWFDICECCHVLWTLCHSSFYTSCCLHVDMSFSSKHCSSFLVTRRTAPSFYWLHSDTQQKNQSLANLILPPSHFHWSIYLSIYINLFISYFLTLFINIKNNFVILDFSLTINRINKNSNPLSVILLSSLCLSHSLCHRMYIYIYIYICVCVCVCVCMCETSDIR